MSNCQTNCPMDPTWHLQCQRGSWHHRLKPTSAWNCNVQFCKKNSIDACSNLLIVFSICNKKHMNMYVQRKKLNFHSNILLMHLQHQHGSRAQEWQQQEHLSHECRQWSDMLDAYELLVLLTYSQQQRKTSCESNVELSNCPMDPTWHLQCQRGSWHLRLKPTSAWNCNVQFCKKTKRWMHAVTCSLFSGRLWTCIHVQIKSKSFRSYFMHICTWSRC